MQTWNDILSYIKINLGVPINLLEIDDDEIIENLKGHVLPFFSQYVPTKKYINVNSSNLVPFQSGQNRFNYKIPVVDEYITDIIEVYPCRQGTTILDDFAYITASSNSMIDTVIANSYLDIAAYLRIRNTWEFHPPDIIAFDQDLYSFIICYNTPHKNLNTIMPDMYHITFKPLCLCHVKLWLAARRSKFESLTLPFGTINLNYQKLEDEARTQIEEIKQKLEILPPDVFVSFG